MADARDKLLNACYGPDPATAVEELCKELLLTGLSETKLNKLKQSVAEHLPPEKKKLPVVTFVAEEKYKTSKSRVQNVADQFLLFIYGKKYNDGVHGAFGKAQQIRSEAKGYKIILKFAEDDEGIFGLKKLMSSVEHYNTSGDGLVVVEHN